MDSEICCLFVLFLIVGDIFVTLRPVGTIAVTQLPNVYLAAPVCCQYD